jgi:hypothetical protein
MHTGYCVTAAAAVGTAIAAAAAAGTAILLVTAFTLWSAYRALV